MVRNSLDKLYLWCGYLAGFFMACIALSVALQVVGRVIGLTIDATEISGMLLAASSFFGLAHALKKGTHVRVTLLVERLDMHRYPRRLVEIFCCGVAAVVVYYLGYHAALLAKQSYIFGDMSPGLIGVPLWIPHSAMAAGLVVLGVALTDELVALWRGVVPSYTENEDAALG